MIKGVDALVTAPQQAGQLRDDVSFSDVLLSLAQLSRPLPGASWRSADEFAHRNLQVYLDGLRAPARSELPGVPAVIEDLRSLQPIRWP